MLDASDRRRTGAALDRAPVSNRSIHPKQCGTHISAATDIANEAITQPDGGGCRVSHRASPACGLGSERIHIERIPRCAGRAPTSHRNVEPAGQTFRSSSAEEQRACASTLHAGPVDPTRRRSPASHLSARRHRGPEPGAHRRRTSTSRGKPDRGNVMKLVRRYPCSILTTVLCARPVVYLADEAYAAAIVAAQASSPWRSCLRSAPDYPPAGAARGGYVQYGGARRDHPARRCAAAPQSDAVVSDLGQFLTFIRLIKLFDRRTPRRDLMLSLNFPDHRGNPHEQPAFGCRRAAGVLRPCWCRPRCWPDPGRGPAGRDRCGRRCRRSFPAPSPYPLVVRRPGRSADRQFIALAASMTLRVALIDDLFFITPRGLRARRLRGRRPARQTTIGYTDVVKLGQSGLLSRSPTPVLDPRDGREDRGIGSPGRYFTSAARPAQPTTSTHLWQSGSSPATIRRSTACHRSAAVQPPHRAAFASRCGRPGATGPIFAVWCRFQVSIQDELGLARQAFQLLQRNNRLPVTVVSRADILAGNERLDPINAATSPGSAGPPSRALRSHRIDQGALDRAPAIRRAANAVRDFLQSRFTYTTDLPPPPSDVDHSCGS